jgi:hypothetical protein
LNLPFQDLPVGGRTHQDAFQISSPRTTRSTAARAGDRARTGRVWRAERSDRRRRLPVARWSHRFGCVRVGNGVLLFGKPGPTSRLITPRRQRPAECPGEADTQRAARASRHRATSGGAVTRPSARIRHARKKTAAVDGQGPHRRRRAEKASRSSTSRSEFGSVPLLGLAPRPPAKLKKQGQWADLLRY